MKKYFYFILLMATLSCGEKTSSQTSTEPSPISPATISTSATAPDPAANQGMTKALAQESTSSTDNQSATSGQVVPGEKSPLTGTYWRMLELNGKNIEGKTAKEMYISFDPSSPQFKSHSGCNLVMGEVKTRGGNQMWFINLLPTSGPCNTPEIDAEFQKAMEEVAEYTVNGNSLVLLKKGSVPMMKFIAKR